ncbi:MAG: hypothetical protein BGO89_08715 [Candidatus Kapaibacterium thiocyanatum]|uniref:2-hydroxy-3-keto-5-methylthiopentenyl-1-phosphate phosphatase n=1 Tax=Candidatus Kapaibacterium thiocyanatum TaxID=1895771 RepID=A0A1M3KW83_9BACT|nr:MAG: hypothetical protein BGO89_08715 ['Candidatus Kapabacteria' thiocyanatum]
MMARMVRIFIDFDGTITREDIGNELFRTFGDFDTIHDDLLAGSISVAEYYRRSCAALRIDTTVEALRDFAEQQTVDASFPALVRWCDANGLPLTVVSDGFRSYIDPILARVDSSHLTVHCNTMERRNDVWQPDFPGASESCSCYCASCKRNVLLDTAGPDDVIVYIGDGHSDRCAAEHADIIFAKGHLAAYCTANGIPHHSFKTLFEVLHVLRTRHEKRAFKQRRQAVLSRKRAFEEE